VGHPKDSMSSRKVLLKPLSSHNSSQVETKLAPAAVARNAIYSQSIKWYLWLYFPSYKLSHPSTAIVTAFTLLFSIGTVSQVVFQAAPS
jgi:hypothetical protein